MIHFKAPHRRVIDDFQMIFYEDDEGGGSGRRRTCVYVLCETVFSFWISNIFEKWFFFFFDFTVR